MAVSKDKLSRRKSIAATVSSVQPTDTRRKRRAHSIAPGKIISPLSRSRLSLGPVKGILKRRKSSESQRSQNQDDSNATQLMDISGQETSSSYSHRQSLLARRVSFSTTAHVRLFGSNHTSSTIASADESPAPSSDDPILSSPPKPPQINDENAYPGASNHNRKSLRFSTASDMDLTSASAGAFLQGAEDISALMEEEFDAEDDDMDVTQVHGNVLRKRSLSTGLGRAPLSQLSSNPLGGGEPFSDEPSNFDESLASERSMNSESDQSGMEFTVPLNQSLRPPQNDQAWMALVKATHSGSAQPPSSDVSMEDMEVDSPVKPISGNDSISDTSFENDFEDGNETINVSKVLGRFSFGDLERRASVAFARSDLDEDSENYGGIGEIAATSTLRPSVAATPSSPLPESEPEAPHAPEPPPTAPPPTIISLAESRIPASTVFSRPVNAVSTASTSKPPSPKKPVFTPKSPSKPASKGFSAAFAPPVSKPTPRKSISSIPPSKDATDKRRHEGAGTDSEQPSPAKRQALANKWASSVTSEPQESTNSTSTSITRPLPPSKTAVFQAPSSTKPPQVSTSTQKPTSSIRRPSGYFARRNSLAVNLGAQASTAEPESSSASTTVRTSPQKKAGIGLGRASLGSGASDAWTRFDRSASAPSSKGKERAVDPPVTISVNPPAPESTSQPIEDTQMDVDGGDAIPQVQTNDLSSILHTGGFGDEEVGVNVQATEQWRDEVAQEEYVENDIPSISIEQFMDMTNIKFMDEIGVPRKSIHPELRRRPREQADIPLGEYAVAMGVDVPRLLLYSRVARELEAWMEDSKANLREAEIEAAKETPQLFVEYSRADEEGQVELVHQLNLIKTNARMKTKVEWIDWKGEWVKALRVTAQEVNDNLEKDSKALTELNAKADAILPAIQAEYDEIMRELEQFQQEIAEVEECDQEYLNELRVSIAEQELEVESLKNDLKERNDELVWLRGRLEDLDTQKKTNLDAIEQADRYHDIQKNSTHSEVFRLKDELEALENIHMFRICKVDGSLFEYVYADRFRVTIPCRQYLPVVDKVQIARTPEGVMKTKDDFPKLTDILLVGAKQVALNLASSETATTRQIVQTLTDYWSSCTQIRGQLLHISVKYPVEIEALPRSAGFKAHATVLFPGVKGKAQLSFVFPTETYTGWPATIETLRCEAKVVYGNLNGQSILDAMRSRLSQATPSDNYACLLDACIEAQEVCGGRPGI